MSLLPQRKLFSPALIAIYIAIFCFLIRAFFAQSNGFDYGLNKAWLKSGVQLGVAGSYSEQVDGSMLPNHPPITIIGFTAAGTIYEAFVSKDIVVLYPYFQFFVKLPAILIDIFLVFVIFFFLRKITTTTWSAIGALLYGLNPVVIYNSAIWNQVDGIYTAFAFTCLVFLYFRKPYLAGCFLALTCLSKVQSVIFLPVFFLLVPLNKKFIFQFLAAAFFAALTVLIPFLIEGNIERIVEVYLHSQGFYKNISLNAYNLWWAVLGGKAGGSDTQLVVGSLTYKHIGLVLFFTYISIVLIFALKRTRHFIQNPKNITYIFGIFACVAFAFFMLNTQMHERYLFPFFAFAIIPCLFYRKYLILYALLSFLHLLNLMAVLPYGWFDKFLYREIHDLKRLIAFGMVIGFLIFSNFIIGIREKSAPKKGKNQFLFGILGVIIILGFFTRIHYFNATSLTTRSHDTMAHVEYVQHIANHFSIPNAQDGWEFHQPPVYYFVAGSVYKLASILTQQDPISAARFLSLAISLLTFVFGFVVAKIFFKDYLSWESIYLIGLLSVFPALIFLSSRITNNSLGTFFTFVVFAALLGWWREKKILKALIFSFLAAIAWLTRDNVVPLIGTFFVCLLFADLNKRQKIIQAAYSACILLVIVGSFFAYRSMQSDNFLTGLSERTNKFSDIVIIENDLKYFTIFNPIKVVATPFNNPNDTKTRREFFWEYFFKSAFFGEWNFGGQSRLAQVVLFLGILSLGFIAKGIHKSYTWNNQFLLPLLVFIILSLILAIAYRIFTSCSCGQDFRLNAGLVLPFAYFWSIGLASIKNIYLKHSFFIVQILFLTLFIVKI